MFDSIVLDVVIGLFTMLFIFSLLTSGVREAGAKLLAARSKELWRQLRILLDGDVETRSDGRALMRGWKRLWSWIWPQRPDARPATIDSAPPPTPPGQLAAEVAAKTTRLSDAFHEHPTIVQLEMRWRGAKKSRLTHIDPRDFTTAFLDVIGAPGGEVERLAALVRTDVESLTDADRAALDTAMPNHSLATVLAGLGAPADGALAALRNAALGLPEGEVKQGILQNLGDLETALAESPIGRGLRFVDQLPEALPLRTELRQILLSGISDLAELRASVEQWFDAKMDSLSAWYRGHTRWVLFIIGLVLAASLNVDAIGVTRELYSNEALRTAAVGLSDEVVMKYTSTEEIDKCVQEFKAKSEGGDDEAATTRDCVRAEVDSLFNTGLPIGWDYDAPCLDVGTSGARCDNLQDYVTDRWDRALDNGLGNNLVKALGWLLTGAAMSMGADFWFNLLGRAKNVKKTVES